MVEEQAETIQERDGSLNGQPVRRREQVVNKSELIQTLAEEVGVGVEESTVIVDTFFDSIREALQEGNRVELRGFGSFKMKEYEGYVGRNPKTGESVRVKPKRMPFFKAGKGLVDLLNE
jgi:integration host factor subunit beta